MQAFWKRFKKIYFAAVFAIFCGTTATLTANYLWSDNGSAYVKEQLTWVAAYYSYFLSMIFFFLVLLVFYAGYRLAARRTKNFFERKLDENNSHSREEKEKALNGLRSEQGAEISRINEKHQNDLQVNEKIQADLNFQISKLRETISKESWLHQEAEKQRLNIDRYVVLENFHYCYISEETVPMLILAAEIRNSSLFEVALIKNIGGFVEFDTLVLNRQPFFNNRSLSKISPGDVSRLTVEIELTGEQVHFVKTFNEKYKISIERALRINKLVFTIVGARDDSGIISKQLYIRDNFKVISSSEYQKALEKFSQY